MDLSYDFVLVDLAKLNQNRLLLGHHPEVVEAVNLLGVERGRAVELGLPVFGRRDFNWLHMFPGVGDSFCRNSLDCELGPYKIIIQ